jgi:hypothetical protein
MTGMMMKLSDQLKNKKSMTLTDWSIVLMEDCSAQWMAKRSLTMIPHTFKQEICTMTIWNTIKNNRNKKLINGTVWSTLKLDMLSIHRTVEMSPLNILKIMNSFKFIQTIGLIKISKSTHLKWSKWKDHWLLSTHPQGKSPEYETVSKQKSILRILVHSLLFKMKSNI